LIHDFYLGPVIVNWVCPTVVNSGMTQNGSIEVRSYLELTAEVEAFEKWRSVYPYSYEVRFYERGVKVFAR
jgi:hypothetical protein